jgi:hypothetical protein
MNRRYSLVLLLASVFISHLAWAEAPPVKEIPAGDDIIVPVKKGAPAPIDGQVFSPETALRWANWLQQYKLRLDWDVKYAEDVCKEETSYRDKLLVISKEQSAATEKSLRDELLKSEKGRLDAEAVVREGPPWYNTTEFGMVVGTAITAGAFALSIWALEARQ